MQLTQPFLMENMSLIARTRAVTIVERENLIAAACANVPECAQEVLRKHLSGALESIFWKKHSPFIVNRPVLPRFAARASVALKKVPLDSKDALGLGCSIVKSFQIMEQIQAFEAIDYQFSVDVLLATISSWKTNSHPKPYAEGLQILWAFLEQCESSKIEKMHLLCKFTQFIPIRSGDIAILGAQLHFLGFLFANSSSVLFEPKKFLETVDPLFRAWMPLELKTIDPGKNCQGYYHYAFMLYKSAGKPIEDLQRFAINCLWEQRRYNLSMRAERFQKKIVVMGAFSLASLTALIEALVAGYSVLVEKPAGMLPSPKMISITQPSMIEALYRYGIAYPILKASGVENFPAAVLKSDLRRFLHQVALSLGEKIQENEQEGVRPIDFFEPNSLQFVESIGLMKVDRAEECPCEAVILGGSRKATGADSLPGLWLRPLEWLYRDNDRQLMAAVERAFFLAGTKIAAFLVGGMECQDINVDGEQSGIASARHLPLFAHHWGAKEEFYHQELASASMERWVGQSYSVALPKFVDPNHITGCLFIHKCLYRGLVNEYQDNVLRTLAILADPELTTSFCEALPLGNASKILSTLKKPICHRANHEIDILREQLSQFIALKQKAASPDEVGRDPKIRDSYVLIEYLKLQKDFIRHLFPENPAMNS